MNSLPGFRELSRAVYRPQNLIALSWVILGLGALLRLLSYLHNRALWLDEILLAWNIKEVSYSGLLKPLNSNQSSPIGFLMIEKLALQTLGDSEYALRLAPLLAGLLSLPLFFALARRCLPPAGTLIALCFFAASDKLVYYSSEVKQYSTDVAIGLMLLLFAVNIHSKKMSWRDAATFGVLGATLIWFSHPAMFILAGVGTTLALHSAYKRDWSRAAFISIAGLMWMTSFWVSYRVILRDVAKSTDLTNFWSSSGAFMPLSIRSVSDAQWFVTAFFQTLRDPAGFSVPAVAGLVFLIGCVSVITGKKYVVLLLSPIPFVLLGSGLHRYPFMDRLLLFIVPSLIVFVAEGINRVIVRAVLIGLPLMCLLFLPVLVHAVHSAIEHDDREDIKPALRHIREHWQPADVIYVSHGARRQFIYYAEKYGFSEDDYVRGHRHIEELSVLEDDVSALRGKRRVWTLFLVDTESNAEERASFLQRLDEAGTRLSGFEGPGVSVYLYDLIGEGKGSKGRGDVSLPTGDNFNLHGIETDLTRLPIAKEHLRVLRERL